MWTPFVTGAVTFVVLALIQSVVIPWVQARTRRRELWEDDVRELEGLVEEVLPRVLKVYKYDSDNLHDVADQVLIHATPIQFEQIQRLAAGLRVSSAALGEQAARLRVLHDRVAGRPAGDKLITFTEKFDSLLTLVHAFEAEGRRDKADGLWRQFEEVRPLYAEVVRSLRWRMRRPRRSTWARLRAVLRQSTP